MCRTSSCSCETSIGGNRVGRNPARCLTLSRSKGYDPTRPLVPYPLMGDLIQPALSALYGPALWLLHHLTIALYARFPWGGGCEWIRVRRTLTSR